MKTIGLLPARDRAVKKHQLTVINSQLLNNINNHKRVLHIDKMCCILVLVFHRILDFKNGLHFYADPFFMPEQLTTSKINKGRKIPAFVLRTFYSSESFTCFSEVWIL